MGKMFEFESGLQVFFQILIKLIKRKYAISHKILH